MIEMIDKINKALAISIRGMVRNPNVAFFGLAEPVVIRDENDITLPVIKVSQGEYQHVLKEADERDLVIYHRLNSEAYDFNGKSFGDGRGCRVTADLSVVAFGCIDQYDLKNRLLGIALSMQDVVPTGCSMNAVSNWASEFVGVPYYMNPEYFMMKFNYKIVTNARLTCKK